MNHKSDMTIVFSLYFRLPEITYFYISYSIFSKYVFIYLYFPSSISPAFLSPYESTFSITTEPSSIRITLCA